MYRKLRKAPRLLYVSIKSFFCLSRLERSEREFISKIKRKRTTYLTTSKLISLLQTCRDIEKAKTEGLFIEAGCALGGSSILISKFKDKGRRLKIYDVFGMIPAPTDKDTKEVHVRYKAIVSGESKGIGGDQYYGYSDNVLGRIKNNFNDFGIDIKTSNVDFIKGLVDETMILDEPVAMAHIDVDWYEPVFICLQRIVPKLVPGGSIIVDDYYDWGGCKKAVDQYFYNVKEDYIMDNSSGAMKITKIN